MRTAPVILRPARLEETAEIAVFHLRVWRAAYHDFVPEQIVKKLDYQNRLSYWIAKLGITNPRQPIRHLARNPDQKAKSNTCLSTPITKATASVATCY